MIATPAKSFEVREGTAPVSVQSDTASLTIPEAHLPSNKAGPIPNKKEPRTAQTEEDQDLAHRWHEESKRRYEELAHEWLELAEQRQRCA